MRLIKKNLFQKNVGEVKAPSITDENAARRVGSADAWPCRCLYNNILLFIIIVDDGSLITKWRKEEEEEDEVGRNPSPPPP